MLTLSKMDESKRMKILVDMDQSLIDAVHEDDHNYHISNGKEVSYTITYIDNIGLKITNSHRVRVSIRPYAIDMVKNIVKYGHIYILWSAGLYEYVHAVMNYFIEASGVRPEFIYTRRDMISYENSIYKSMVSKGYKIDEILMRNDTDNDERVESYKKLLIARYNRQFNEKTNKYNVTLHNETSRKVNRLISETYARERKK